MKKFLSALQRFTVVVWIRHVELPDRLASWAILLVLSSCGRTPADVLEQEWQHPHHSLNTAVLASFGQIWPRCSY